VSDDREPLIVRVMRRNVMAYRALYAAVEGDLGPAERLVALDALADDADLVTLHTASLDADAVGEWVVQLGANNHNTFIARIGIEPPERWRLRSIVIGNKIVFGDHAPCPGVPVAALDSVLPPLFLPVGQNAELRLVSAKAGKEPSVLHVLGTQPF
jgi:hypothetical protein